MDAVPRSRWYVLRHARPLVAAGLCYGQWDIPADADATTAAAAVFARHWHATHGAHQVPVQVVCSPLQRCRQLAQALGRVQPGILGGGQHRVDAALAELDFGAWEGVAWADLPPDAWTPWMADFAHYRPGGGESTAQLLQRVQGAARYTARSLLDQPHAVCIWVTHAGVMRALHWLQQHGSALPASAGQWPQQGACAYGEWLTLTDEAVRALL